MAMLFEYAATLGLIDIAYIAPQRRGMISAIAGARMITTCLSRYDGLKYFRINALGAWCLGLTAAIIEPEAIVIPRKTWRVLPNHDVVSSELNPDPVDVMFLDRVADRTSDRVWRLDREKILTAVEDGLDDRRDLRVPREPQLRADPADRAKLLADLQEIARTRRATRGRSA